MSSPAKVVGPSNEPFELLTSTRFDSFLLSLRWNNDQDGPSPFLLLPYHFDRLIAAAERHGWGHVKCSLTYEKLKSACNDVLADQLAQETSNAFKIRLTISKVGSLTASASPTSPLTSDPTSSSFFNPTSDYATLFGPLLIIHMDSQPTATSLFTVTKTTHRTVYDEARARAGIHSYTASANPPDAPSDVLLYTPQHLISETSIFNVAFYRSSHWITPPETTGCLPGVLRRWLLEEGRIKEGILTKDSIKEGDWVLLFNSVQGARLARVAKC